MRELELYLHIPFCVKKCDYCDFLSFPGDAFFRSAYVKRLTEEIRYCAPEYGNYRVSSIFFGGGTPSLLEGGQIAALMEELNRSFKMDGNVETSIECNPGTLDGEKAKAFIRAGINRVSVGLQSALNRELALLGRIHTYEQFLESFEQIRKAGCRNLNVDLMSGLPGQKPTDWEQTLRRVTMLRPEHISAYSLMIGEGTPFYERYRGDEKRRERGERPFLLPTEEEEREMYEMTQSFLSDRGYFRYEISNYARKGWECRHNIGYWTRREYLGLGLGASSLIGDIRFSNTPVWEKYMEEPFSRMEERKLGRKEQMEEYMFLGLRMSRGILRDDFLRQFGTEPEGVYGDLLQRLKAEGLLAERERRIFLTPLGIDVSNQVLAQFLL